MQQAQKTDAKKTTKSTKKPAPAKAVAAKKDTRSAAERKADREAMAKTQPMNAITEAMVKAHAQRDERHELADTRQTKP